jgi:GntR family transcriptional repressor for pyruvate dehydrogenase complex
MTGDPSHEPLFEPIALPRRNFEAVAIHIRQQIRDGKLQPGDKLPSEAELARRLSVGRSATREALKVLELSGLLTVRRGYNGGTFVTLAPSSSPPEPTSQLFLSHTISLAQLVEARETIELRATELAAQRSAGAQGSLLLGAIVATQEQHLARPGQALSDELEFHIALAQLSGNEVFVVTLRALQPLLARSRVAVCADAGLRRALLEQHRAIARAVAAADPERAVEAMRYHLRFIAACVEQVASEEAPPPR